MGRDRRRLITMTNTFQASFSSIYLHHKKVEEMIGSLVGRLEPSTDCIVWRSLNLEMILMMEKVFLNVLVSLVDN